MNLRPYQMQMIEGARSAFRQGHKRIILEAPTGSGKTVISAFMLKTAVDKGKRVLFIVHRDYLMTQSSSAFRKIGLEHGLIAPQYKPVTSMAQIASVMTLARRVSKLPAPDLVVIDEAHRSMGNTYRNLLSLWPKATIVGVTATPERLDKKSLGDIYTKIVSGPKMRWLIENGFLADYRVFVPPCHVDLEGVKTKFGDYDQEELEKRVDKPRVTGSAIEHYQRLLDGKRAVVFCTTINHSLHVTASFNAAGISAEHIDGETSFADRRAIIARFESSETKILCNVALVSEGFDLPAVEGVIMLHPTKSLVRYIQSVGRCLRPAPGKTHAIILDHVGNVSTHGMPDKDREWSLDKKKKKEKKSEPSVPTRTCKECYAVNPITAKECIECGAEFESKKIIIDDVDGKLVEVTALQVQEARSNRKQLIAGANTYEQLQLLAVRFGYKKGWAWHVWQDKQKKNGITGNDIAVADYAATLFKQRKNQSLQK